MPGVVGCFVRDERLCVHRVRPRCLSGGVQVLSSARPFADIAKVGDTFGALLEYQDDVTRVQAKLLCG